MKSLEEVKKFLKDDWKKIFPQDNLFGWARSSIAEFNPDSYKPGHKSKCPKLTRKNIIKVMKDYISFAWEKANDKRGISANRSIEHFKGWLWLLGDEEVVEYLKANYTPYGKPGLAYICKKYGFRNEDNGDTSCC